jgi:predicted PurR-regulated permease PerM
LETTASDATASPAAAEDESDAEVPSWLNRLAQIGWRVLVTVALGLVILYLAAYLSTVTLSILFGVIAVATLGPLQERLLARGWGRAKASAGALLIAVAVVIVALVLILLALVPSLVQLAQNAQAGVARLDDDMAKAGFPSQLAASINTIITQVQRWVEDQATSIVSSIAEVATIVMLGLFLTFYFLLDGQKGWDVGLRDLREWRRVRIRTAGEDAMRRAGGYIRGTATIASVNAVAAFAYLTVLGVPLAGPLAIVVLVAGFVPYIGGVFASAVIVLSGYASGGLTTAAVLLGLMLITNVAEHRYLRPSILGRTLDLHPAIVLIALLIGFTMGGIVGMFVAVPTFAVITEVSGAIVDALGERDADEASLQAADIPDWLDRLAQWSWRLLVGGAFVLLFVVIAGQIPAVIGPIVVAITLAATFLPAARVLEAKRGWSRARASLVISIVLWVTVAIVTILSVAALVAPAIDSVQGSITAAQTGATTADGSLPTGVSGTVSSLSDAVGSGLLSTLASLVTSIAFFVLFLVLSALMAFFFLRDGSKAWAWVTGRIGGWREQEIRAAGDRAVVMLGGYMIATGVLGAFNAVTGFVIMTLLGIPFALPVAVLSFFGGFIPYIGQFVTSAIAFLITVAFGTTQDIIFMALWTAVFNIVQGSVIAPLVYGRAVSLHPAIVLIVIPAGYTLAGVLGMFLAVPVVGIAGAVWRHILAAIGEIPPSLPDPDAEVTLDPAATVAAPTAPPDAALT